MKDKFTSKDTWRPIRVMAVKGTYDYSIVQYESGECYLVPRINNWYSFFNIFKSIVNRKAMKLTIAQADKWKIMRTNQSKSTYIAAAVCFLDVIL